MVLNIIPFLWGMSEHRISHMLGKLSSTGQHSQPLNIVCHIPLYERGQLFSFDAFSLPIYLLYPDSCASPVNYVHKQKKNYFMPQFFKISGNTHGRFYSPLQDGIKEKVGQQGVS